MFWSVCSSVVLTISLCFCACESPVDTDLIQGSPPKFIFNHPEALTGVVVYRIPSEYVNKGIPGDMLNDSIAVWEIRGQLQNPKEPIVYGIVPTGMSETIPAKSLEEGQGYLLRCFQNDNGGCSGVEFTIKDGEAVNIN